jgi:hypothetical protein
MNPFPVFHEPLGLELGLFERLETFCASGFFKKHVPPNP